MFKWLLNADDSQMSSVLKPQRQVPFCLSVHRTSIINQQGGILNIAIIAQMLPSIKHG
jgi:hypothetical protein